MTDPRVTAAARVLNKRHAELCNVNEADSWAIQGHDFIEDARAAIAAADAALAARPEPVAKVKIHRTGGNAGLAWSGVPIDGAPLMRDGDPLYAQPVAAPAQPCRYPVCQQGTDPACSGPCAAPAQPLSSACLECGGSGMRDSGGFLPWGESALVPCDCEAPTAQPATHNGEQA